MGLYANKIDKMYNDFDISGFLTKSITGTTIDANELVNDTLKGLQLPTSLNDMVSSMMDDMGLSSLLPNSDGVDILKLILSDMESTLSGLGIGLKARNGLLSLTLEKCFNFDISFDFSKFLKFNLLFRLGIEFSCGKDNVIKMLYDNEIKDKTKEYQAELATLTTTIPDSYNVKHLTEQINVELQGFAEVERERRNEIENELQELIKDPIKNHDRIKALMEELDALNATIKVIEENATSDTLTDLRNQLAIARRANLANTPSDLTRLSELMALINNAIKSVREDYSTIITLAVQHVDADNALRLLNNLVEIDGIELMITPTMMNSISTLTNNITITDQDTPSDELGPLERSITVTPQPLPKYTERDELFLLRVYTILVKIDSNYAKHHIGDLSPTMRLAYLFYLNANPDIGTNLPDEMFALLANRIPC